MAKAGFCRALTSRLSCSEHLFNISQRNISCDMTTWSRSLAHIPRSQLQRYRKWNLEALIDFGKTCQLRSCQTSAPSQAAGEARNIDPGKSRTVGTFHFDTLAMVKRLVDQGYTQQQAEALTQEIVDVISVALDLQTKAMVTKPQQEIMVQQLLSHIAAVKKDMVILEKSEFTMIRNETEKQSTQIKQLGHHLEEEVKKLRGQVKLEINLERSRATEAHALNEKNLQSLDNKIDVEISNLKTLFEKYRGDVIRLTFGTVFACITIGLGILRLMH